MKWLFFIFCAGLVFGCDDAADSEFQIFTSTFDFRDSDHGWSGGFADYPTNPDDTVFYGLKFSYTISPPAENLSSTNALMLSGNNHSDDLFMFVKKKIDGLRPNTTYTVTYEVEFASDAKLGSVGIGGSPGESVFMKVGATAVEPRSIPSGSIYRMNIDKGNQAEDGQDMIAIGNIAVSENATGYLLTTRTNYGYSNDNGSFNKPFEVTTSDDGEVWLIVGTDSGFEGNTTIYYTRITAVFSRN